MPDFEDDELDRRIRATLQAAGSDAPTGDTPPDTATNTPDRRRWWAAAAAVLLVAAGVAALIARGTRDTDSATATSSVSTSNSANPATVVTDPSTTTEPAPTTTTLSVQDCDSVAPARYDNEGSMHTIAPNAQPIDVEVAFSPTTWCPGGLATVTVVFTNRGVGVEHLESPMLILNGGMAKWPITDLESFDLGSGEHKTVIAEVQVPDAPPGSYRVHIYGFDGGTQIEVRGAEVCDGSNLTSVATGADGAMGNVRTDLLVTNTSGAPCLLTTPAVILAREFDQEFQVNVHEGTYFGDPDPLPSRVLQPGTSALMILGTSNGCDTTPAAHPWDQLVFSFGGPIYGTPLVVSLPSLQPTCGLSISTWGSPRT